MTCTLCGHRDFPQEMQPALQMQIADLIARKGADRFYVGNQGGFDFAVLQALRACKAIFPQIRYSVVLAYMPRDALFGTSESETVFPEAVAAAPRRFAISYRNRWMLERADCVVTYIRHDFGGAAQFAAVAARRGKLLVWL